MICNQTPFRVAIEQTNEKVAIELLEPDEQLPFVWYDPIDPKLFCLLLRFVGKY